MITAYRAEPDELDAILEANTGATLRCDPNEDPAPPEKMVRKAMARYLVFVAREDDRIVGTAILQDPCGPIQWMAHMGSDPAETLNALCQAIHDTYNHDPHGHIKNPETLAAVAHPNLHNHGGDPSAVIWRRHG